MPPLSTTSTIPLFKAALVTRLQTDANIVAAKAVVSYGNPYPEPTVDEWIWVGSSTSLSEEAAALGLGRREEWYTIDVIASKRADARETQQVVTERAFVLASYIETSVRSWGGYATAIADPFSYSVTGVRVVEVVAVDHIESLGPDKRFCLVNITLRVKARI